LAVLIFFNLGTEGEMGGHSVLNFELKTVVARDSLKICDLGKMGDIAYQRRVDIFEN
jgi:hypothetical protein